MSSIPELEFTKKIFLDRSTMLYGTSDTGKTIIINDILYHLREEVSQIFVFSGSENANGTYSSVSERALIFKDITESHLEEIWSRQEMIAAVYRKANDLNTLSRLFARLELLEPSRFVQRVKGRRQEAIREIKGKFGRDNAQRDEELTKFRQKYDDYLRVIYKFYINKFSSVFRSAPSDTFTEDEKYCLEYLNLNPRLLIVVDDLVEQLKVLQKTQIMAKMYTKGRWNFITFLFSIHNETCLSPDFRKGAFVSIFTTAESAVSFFSKDSNGLKHKFKDVKEACKHIFPSNSEESFEKLVYVRKGQRFFRYKASTHKKFTAGSSIIRAFCKLVASDDSTIDKTNPFYATFKV